MVAMNRCRSYWQWYEMKLMIQNGLLVDGMGVWSEEVESGIDGGIVEVQLEIKKL